jgi:hypothetical protein
MSLDEAVELVFAFENGNPVIYLLTKLQPGTIAI